VFTAQAPFLPVFLLGFLATNDSDRTVAKNWFETVITATSCRSVSTSHTVASPALSRSQSVPPAWEALQRIQQWMDVEIVDSDETPDFEYREPWWEAVVARLNKTEGILCLI
jgi:hypothetical protein